MFLLNTGWGAGSAGAPCGKAGMTGLTRRDVLALLLCIFVLGVIGLKFLGGGETRRIWVCKHRLGNLGAAFAKYAKDSGNSLPPAVVDVGRVTTTWDMAVAPYLSGSRSATDPAHQEELKQKLWPMFHCPSDTEPRGGEVPRSYSMPMYDVKKVGWPPTEDSQGGLGLYLDADRWKLIREAEPTLPAGSTPAIRLSIVPNPGWTALLVEQITIRNTMFSTNFAATPGPRDQWNAKTISLENFHRGKLNYLMLDGHVERLTIRESGGHAGNGGVWTIRAWD